MSVVKIKKAYPYLCLLSDNLKDKFFLKKILNKPEVLHSLAELSLNLLLNNINLTRKEKNQLKKIYPTLKLLISKKPTKIRKLFIKDQRGSGLFTLLKIGIPLFAALINTH